MPTASWSEEALGGQWHRMEMAMENNSTKDSMGYTGLRCKEVLRRTVEEETLRKSIVIKGVQM